MRQMNATQTEIKTIRISLETVSGIYYENVYEINEETGLATLRRLVEDKNRMGKGPWGKLVNMTAKEAKRHHINALHRDGFTTWAKNLDEKTQS